MNNKVKILVILVTMIVFFSGCATEREYKVQSKSSSQYMTPTIPDDEIDLNQIISEVVKVYDLHDYVNFIKDGKVDKKLLQILYTILENTNEVYVHQQRKQYGNKVFLILNGKLEAVYGSDGMLVIDGMNQGSYNYYHPQKEPLLHFIADMYLWIIWGSTPQDPTSTNERIFSYISDYEGGFRRVYEKRDKILDNDFKKEGQIETLALFLKIIEEGGEQSIFDFFNNKLVFNDDNILRVLKGMEHGMCKLFKNKIKK